MKFFFNDNNIDKNRNSLKKWKGTALKAVLLDNDNDF